MPTSEDIGYIPIHDMLRVCYVGALWGHGPGHTKGDEYGNPRWWDRPDYYDDPSYAHAYRMERLWGTLQGLRDLIPAYSRRVFDNCYAVRRSHYCPDLTPGWVIKELWPEYSPRGDPLAMDQYYGPINGNYIVNEHQTPLGQYFREMTRDYLRAKLGYSPGFINDMSHTSVFRHADPIAQKSPGRAFSRDKGPYVLGHCGRRDRYDVVTSFVDDGHRITMWSDGGWMSYVTCGHSASMAIEGAYRSVYLTALGPAFRTARYLLGEKPLTALIHAAYDVQGRYFKPDQFTPESLRAYYRHMDESLSLFALEHGITLSCGYLPGHQEMIELTPLLVESVTLGRRTHPGGYVDPPLWMIRAGRGVQSLLALGNPSATEVRSDIRLLSRCFGGSPLFVPYFGGQADHQLAAEASTISGVKLGGRGIAGYRCAGLLSPGATGQARISIAGDGIDLRLTFQLDLAQPAELAINTFAPIYRLDKLSVNGQAAETGPDGQLALPAGTSAVEAVCRNRVFDFSARDWAAVELIKDGQTNFSLVADRGLYFDPQAGEGLKQITEPTDFPFGFERGTAMMLNHFISQYDEENGRLGDYEPAPIVAEKPKDYAGWTVILKTDPLAGEGRVRIDPATREIVLVGRTQGEVRKAMVTLLRLVDRKYPHVGTFVPIRGKGRLYQSGEKDPIDVWLDDKFDREFFHAFADPHFVTKPILRAEFESAYADGNRDFTGKYTMRVPPNIVEPTFADTFVYGYAGPGWAEAREEMNRPLRPERQAWEKTQAEKAATAKAEADRQKAEAEKKKAAATQPVTRPGSPAREKGQ